MQIEFKELQATVTQWMETTNEYRRSLCDKIEEVRDRLSQLPCRERFEMSRNIDKHISALWIFITGIVMAIVGSWVKFLGEK